MLLNNNFIYSTIFKKEYFRVANYRLFLFQMHLTKKHSSECQHYRCKFCPEQIFHNQISAEMHISQHVPRLFNPVRKSSAFGPFPFRTEFNSRVERIVKSLQCPFCRQCFKGEYLHQMHMIKEHKDYREVLIFFTFNRVFILKFYLIL